jgi:hypothetical protein
VRKGGEFLSAKESCLGAFVNLHGRLIAQNWSKLTECVQTGKPVLAADRKWLQQASFTDVRTLPGPSSSPLVLATRAWA